MARKKLSPGQKTVVQDFKLPASMRKALREHAKRLGKKTGEVCRQLITNWVMSQNLHQHRKAVAKRAKKRSQVTLQIGTKEKRRE